MTKPAVETTSQTPKRQRSQGEFGSSTGDLSRQTDAQRTTKEAGTTTYLTARQLAERWQVPVCTIYAWVRRNALPHYRAGRLLRFDAAAVEEHFRRAGFAEQVVPEVERPGEAAFALLTE